MNGLQGIPCLIYLYWLFFCTVIIVVATVVVIFAVSVSVVVVFFGYRFCHCCCFCNCFCCCCCCCCYCRCSWCHSTVVVLGVCSTLIKSLLVVGGVNGAYNLWIRSYSNINCTGKIIRIFLVSDSIILNNPRPLSLYLLLRRFVLWQWHSKIQHLGIFCHAELCRFTRCYDTVKISLLGSILNVSVHLKNIQRIHKGWLK